MVVLSVHKSSAFLVLLYRCRNHKIQDVAFYDEKILSLLLAEDNEDEKPVLVQVPLAVITDQMFTPVPQGSSVTDVNM